MKKHEKDYKSLAFIFFLHFFFCVKYIPEKVRKKKRELEKETLQRSINSISNGNRMEKIKKNNIKRNSKIFMKIIHFQKKEKKVRKKSKKKK